MKELDGLLSEFEELMPGWLGNTEDVTGFIGLSELFDYLKNEILGSSGRFLGLLALCCGMALMLTLCDLLASEYGNAEVLRSVCAICFSVPLLRSFTEMLTESAEGINAGCELFGGMIPLLCSVYAAGGASTTSATAAASMSFTLSLVSGVVSKGLFPLAAMILVSSLTASFDTGQGARRISKSLGKLFALFLGAVTTVLVATVSLQGVISSAKDSVAIRGARYAISGMVPAIGSTVGATLGTLVSGANLIASTMGVGGAVALAATIGAPLLRILLCRAAMRSGGMLAAVLGSDNAERFFDSVCNSLDLILSVLAAVLVAFVLEVVIFMKAAVGV